MFVLSITFVLKIKCLLDLKIVLRQGVPVRDELRLFLQFICKIGYSNIGWEANKLPVIF